MQVTFGVGDAIAYGRTIVESRLMQPAPELKEFVSGDLTDIAILPGNPSCLLKVLILARSDVKSVRNGVWHAKPDLIESIDEPWRTVNIRAQWHFRSEIAIDLTRSRMSLLIRRPQVRCTDVRVDLRRYEALMPEEFLHAADVGPAV